MAKRTKRNAVGRKSKAAGGTDVTKPQRGVSRTHVAVPGSRRPAKKGAVRVRDADPAAPVFLTLTLRGPDLPDANNLPTRALTPGEFASQYGASQEDADKVASVLERYGLKIDEVSLPTRSIRVSGTVKTVEAAFHPDLGIYESADQGEFRDREADYQIPGTLKGIVTAVLGLGQRRVARRNTMLAAMRANVAHKLAPLTPTDLEQHYNFPPGDAQGQKIGIAEFGGGYFAEDMAAYCAKFGRPAPKVNAVSINRPAFTLQQIRQLPTAQRNDELESSVEVMMDVEIVAGLCSKAEIDVYFATFDQKGWVDLLNRAIMDRPVTLSISWGLAEDDPDWSAAARDEINKRLNAAAALGITVCIASGDDGSGDQIDDGKGHVDFPSSSPFVLSVGGTMLTAKASGVVEQVWWESPGRRTQSGGGAGGGGVSIFFDRPQWQAVKITSINKGSIDGRVIPDVAALAGDPLYDLIVIGGDAPNGGTSASAPLWAALIARINAVLPAGKQQRFLTPLLYQAGQGGKPVGQTGCRDIVTGDNASHPKPGTGYHAGKGFDAASGWGTPIGTVLKNAL